MSWAGGLSVEMTDEEFRLVRDLVYEHCGIFLPDNMKYLVERRVRPRLAVYDLASFRDYYRLLKYGRDRSTEFDQIVERITTNETYFFREDYQLRSFVEEIIPDIVKDREPDSPIRIWSAGCSSGEEPYTIAMVLEDCLEAKGRTFEIFGNDISRRVLRLARDGVYRASSFRQTDRSYMQRFFVQEGDTYRLREHIRRRVTFGHLNLMDEAAMALIANVDVVFCRNVMIYFANESRERLVDILHKKLRPGGYLLLGHSESLINVSTGFELMPMKSDIAYRKPR